MRLALAATLALALAVAACAPPNPPPPLVGVSTVAPPQITGTVVVQPQP